MGNLIFKCIFPINLSIITLVKHLVDQKLELFVKDLIIVYLYEIENSKK